MIFELPEPPLSSKAFLRLLIELNMTHLPLNTEQWSCKDLLLWPRGCFLNKVIKQSNNWVDKESQNIVQIIPFWFLNFFDDVIQCWPTIVWIQAKIKSRSPFGGRFFYYWEVLLKICRLSFLNFKVFKVEKTIIS